MSTQQPEALRLADECGTGYPLEEDAKKAAAELRRLHAELESIKQAITDPENQPSQYGTVLMSDQPEKSAPVFKPCSCRWNGETQVQQCTLHAAHIDAIHEWAERAKTAEAELREKNSPEQSAAYKAGMEYQERVEMDLLEALVELLTDMEIAQGNMLDAAKRDPKWQGCAEAIQPRVDKAIAAISKATGGAV